MGPFLDNTALCDKACGFSYALREHAPYGEIPAFRRISRASPSAQCKDLNARECRFRVGKIFALASCNIRDGSQHDDRRDRKLNGKCHQPKAPPAAPDAVAKALCRSCDPA